MKKVLCIDGGGIKGVFPAALLAEVEDAGGSPIGDYFDLVVGTSTGGIIALALGLGFSASETLAFYDEFGPSVFCGNRYTRWLRHLSRTKYDSQILREALEKQFGARRLGESRLRLVIPSTQLETGEVHIYKTAHHRRFERDFKQRAVDVALATASAPSYFPTHRSAAGTPLVDGGVWSNNPAGLAAVEALSILDWRRGEIELLSIGCTTHAPDVRTDSLFGGKLYWATKIVDVMMTAQSSSSLGTAKLLLGHDHVHRVN